MKQPILLATILAMLSPAYADELPDLARPLDIPLYLSGNFGELRPNHFHSGLDFKTQGRTGLAVHSADDGYVSRVVVSPWGFGRAVYVTHPATGLTTVYGHLDSFAKKIDDPVRREQYRQESFRVDLNFKPGEIPVSKGEVIARSGNSGSSGGPHLHMDVRDTETEHALDPMPYFKKYIADKVAPQMRTLALYAVPGEGIIDTGRTSAYNTAPGSVFKAWGHVVPGIKAYDRMTGTQNIYGIKYLTLTVDGHELYRRVIDEFDFADTRAVNTLVNYRDMTRSKSWVMTSAVPQSQPLGQMVTAGENNGILHIDHERDYKCVWTLEDEHGNRATVPFTIRGVKAPVPKITPKGDRLSYEDKNTYNGDGFTVEIPKGVLYDDIYFTASATPSDSFRSPVVSVGDSDIPLAGNYTLTIDVKPDNVTDKRRYCTVRTDGKHNVSVGGKYSDGKMTTEVNRFGRYAVTTDSKAPVITPENKAMWGKNGRISYRVSDNLSGIDSYRCEIDGKWVMLEHDGKTGRLSYRLEPERVTRGKSHNVVLIVTDTCGNTSTSTETMTW
ncbi:MAG: M23 family metallopeptidase [Pseudoflavonifractor sp.]|nr:M23 family metallopeptidase [Pseudoflavonifractor sp.]